MSGSPSPSTTGGPLRLLVLCPHFAPDTAPTGVVMTRIVEELAGRGHHVEVVTALPWYRGHAIEPGWGGRPWRTERTAWGRIHRVHPFPGGDKRNLARRAVGFAGFSALSGLRALAPGPIDATIAMSPPLTMGITAWLAGGAALGAHGPLVFNIQDVFPDAAVRTGAITNRRVIAALSWLERFSYRRAAAVTVLSDDLAANVRAKVPGRESTVHVIPNFVDTVAIRPGRRETSFRRQYGIGDEPVVMYAGNVGFSQSLTLLLDAARQLPAATFVINGDGSARAELQAAAAGLGNVRFTGYQPADRLAEVLASADVHVVPLRAGLGAVSVPSKTYSIMAAARPVVAAIDAGTEVPRLLEASGGGVAVPPDESTAFVAALADLLGRPDRGASLGAAGRRYVEQVASPAAVAVAYESLIRRLLASDRR